ncbi:AAA family ATPase [Streptomyces sp. NPDC093970]|uniref:ATP-binding protein n=1 Tax=Streptomyces sp. NPDC093970 TaxID=3155076 RepID=UPI00341FBF81
MQRSTDQDGAETGRAPGSPRFVGRKAELAELTGALTGPATLVLVEGEAGIGKSRLVREALRAADVHGPKLLAAVCPPFREALTLGPVVEALRDSGRSVSGLRLSALAGTLRPLFPEWAGGLPPSPEPLSDARAARFRLLSALRDLLDGLGTEVLVVEDVHWADEATLDLLVLLASRHPTPLTLVLTYRPEDVEPGSVLLRLSSRSPAGGRVRIRLGGLPVSATAELVSSMLDDEHVSDAFATFLHDRTEGVPLALEECVRLLRDRADVIRQGGEWVRRTLADITVPPTIRDAVAERAVRLGRDARQVLLAAAVLTGPADESVIAVVAALPEDRAAAGLEEALSSGLLVEDGSGRIVFRHVLAARAVYDQAPASTRRGAHRRAAEVLEEAGRPAPDRLAHHFREAGDTFRWRRYAEQAADLALASGDHLTAVTSLHELITHPGCPAEAVAPLVRKMPLHAFTGYHRRDEIVATLRALLDAGVLGGSARTELGAQVARMLIHAGDHAAAAAELERVVPGLTDRTYPVIWAMTVLGVPFHDSWPVQVHLGWLDRAERALERSSVTPAERLTLVVDRLTALLDLDDDRGAALADALAVDESDPRIAQQLARAVLNTGHGVMKWGRYEDACRRLTSAVDIAGRHGYQRLKDMATVTLLHLDWYTGRWEGLADRLAEWLDVDGEPLISLDARLVHAQLRAAQGQEPAAATELRTVREESVRRGLFDIAAEASGALARLALAAGAPQEVLALTGEPVARITRKELWLWATDVVPARVVALAGTQGHAEAEALTTGFEEGLRGRHRPRQAAALRMCRAAVLGGRGEHLRAADAWGEAAQAWQALPSPYEALWCREMRARCLRAAGRADLASAELGALRSDFADLGAAADAERVLREIDVCKGEAPRARGGRRGYGDQLSPRELEVVRLVAKGFTNREIAAELSRSPKTVATQLNSAMRKHGVSTRTALAVRLTEERTAAAEPGPPDHG